MNFLFIHRIIGAIIINMQFGLAIKTRIATRRWFYGNLYSQLFRSQTNQRAYDYRKGFRKANP